MELIQLTFSGRESHSLVGEIQRIQIVEESKNWSIFADDNEQIVRALSNLLQKSRQKFALQSEISRVLLRFINFKTFSPIATEILKNSI